MTTYYIDLNNGNDASAGTSWSTAWRTITNGATAARIAPGDEIRISKTEDPISVGSATWTNGSKIVTLSSPLTQNIDLCDVVWTAVSASTVTRTTNRKEGTHSATVSKLSASPNQRYAYRTLPTTLNLSLYNGVTFWVRNTSTTTIDNWQLVLGSDTIGAAPVDVFRIPAIAAISAWMPVTLTSSSGLNLGSSINSVALYTGASVPAGTLSITVDGILACNTGSLSLQSLIGKNIVTEGWYGLQSISGSTINLDTYSTFQPTSNTNYAGSSGAVTTYIRHTYKTTPSSTGNSIINTINDSGTSGNPVVYSCGWNTGSNVQDGQTFFDGLNGYGYGLYASSKNYVTFNNAGFHRYFYGAYFSGNQFQVSFASLGTNYQGLTLSSCNNSTFQSNAIANNGYLGVSLSSCVGTAISASHIAGNPTAGVNFSNSSICTLSSSLISRNGNYGIDLYQSHGNTIISSLISNNTSYGIRSQYSHNNKLHIGGLASNPTSVYFYFSNNNQMVGSSILSTMTCQDSFKNYLKNCTVSNVGIQPYYTSAKVFSHNHASSGNHKIFFELGGIFESLTTTRPGAVGKMWRNSGGFTSTPYRHSIGKVYCEAGVNRTIKAWIKKDDATQADVKLIVKKNQSLGINADVTNTAASNTSWQQLSVSVSAAVSGVVEVEIWIKHSAYTSNVYYDQELIVT